MSQKRQESSIVVRTLAVRYPAGLVIPGHAHDWHQLVYATEGVMSVHAAMGFWIVPPRRAVWVPSGVEHSIQMSGSVSMRTLYFARRLRIALPASCCVLSITPLMRELILHAVGIGMLRNDEPLHAHLVEVLLDQLNVLPAMPLQLPAPKDPRAQRASEHLDRTPAARIDELEKVAGASRRTLERLFRTETGLSLGRWRQQLRLLKAVRALAAGGGVTSVALDVGYESPSAFIAVFRRTFGVTPSRYFADS